MSGMTRIVGLDETVAYLNTLDVKARARVHAVIAESADNVVSKAKARAPKDTGKLQGDIRIRDKAKLDQGELTATVTYTGKKKAYWGVFAEFGTKDRPASPFLGPAWQSEEPIFIQKIIAAIKGL